MLSGKITNIQTCETWRKFQGVGEAKAKTRRDIQNLEHRKLLISWVLLKR